MRTKESYVLEPLHSVDEDTSNIDELLYEAVERNSTISVNAVLKFALGDEQELGVAESQRTESSSFSLAWKNKVNVKAVILAAQKGNYELIKLFLSRGFRIDAPHEILCGCYTCKHDPLGSTKARIMTYSAISNPMWIALTSEDPFLTAFSLSREITLLQNFEDSYENAFAAMKAQVQTFCLELLDCVESGAEQLKIVNMIEHVDRSDEDVTHRPEWSLKFIKCAFTYKLKKVSHALIDHLFPLHLQYFFEFQLRSITLLQWFSSGIPWNPRVPLVHSRGSARRYTNQYMIDSKLLFSCANM